MGNPRRHQTIMDHLEQYKHEYKQIRRVFGVSPGRALPIDTRLRRGDRKLLPVLCEKLGHRRGAEIGVRTGGFAEMFCKVGVEIWCVDPWSPVRGYSQARQNKHLEEAERRLGPLNAHMVQKFSMDALEDVPDDLDFVHIDGNHEFDYVMEDIIHWHRKIRPGGIIALHDYHLSGVKRAIEAYTLAHHIDPWFVLKNHQPTVFWVHP